MPSLAPPKGRANRQHVFIVLPKTTEGAQEGFHQSDLEEGESNIEAQAMDHVLGHAACGIDIAGHSLIP